MPYADPNCQAAIKSRRAKQRRYRLAHPERVATQQKVWRSENQNYRAENKDRINEINRNSRRGNPKYLEQRKAAQNTRRARKSGGGGSYTVEEISSLMAEQKGHCAHPWCGADITAGYHIDHYMPLALGGSNWIENIQLLCEPCNLQKGALHPSVFAEKLMRALSENKR